jgi:small subunit ribosomal protein S20
MPNTKSATKALRQSVKRRVKNRTIANAYKTALKEYHRLVKDDKIKEAKAYFAKVQKRLDKAAKTGVIKKNKASRLKSRASAHTAKA